MQRFTAVLKDLALTFAAGTFTLRLPDGHEQALQALFMVVAAVSLLGKAAAWSKGAGDEEYREEGRADA